MLRRLLICLLPILFGTTALHAQWQWMDNSEGTAGFERVYDVAVDDVRNAIYSVGCVDGSPNFPEISNASLAGNKDGFVMKYDTSGTVLWAFAFGGTNNDCASAVAVDTTTGNIFVTGYIIGNSADLSGTAGGISGAVSGANGQDGFIASYNDLGQLLWFELIGGSGFDGGTDVTVNEGGVYVNGYYTNTGLLSALLSIVLPINGELNNFVMSFNKTNGSFQWDAIQTSTSDDYSVPGSEYEISKMGITSDANNIYLVTQKGGDNYRIRDASGSIVTTLSNPDNDFVVTSYTNGGAHNWSVLYDNNGNQVFGLDITNDCSGVYVTGTMHNGGVTPGGTVITSLHDDYILAKLNKSNGSELWVKEFNSIYNHDDYFVGLDADGYGNLYAVGRLRGTATSLNSEFTYTSGPSHSEVMIAHFFTNGTFESFETYSSTDDSWAMSVATYKNEKYVVGGYYSDNLSFGGVGVSSSSDENAFVALRNLDAPIAYSSSSGTSVFCQDETNPIPNMNVVPGGIFSGPSEVIFANSSTGEIDLANSIPGGPYTITYTASALNCSGELFTTEMEIVAVDDPAFSYSDTIFCTNESNPIPSSIATVGGTFSTNSGVVINTSSGEIDIQSSPVGGPYYIVYTTNNAICPRQDSVSVYIETVPNAAFTYGQSTFCQDANNPIPSFVAQAGGIFSSASGLVFADATTGEIDLSASTPGGYTILYVVSSTNCVDSATFDVSIVALEDASFTFSETTFCEDGPNVMPNFVANPGGAFFAPTGLTVANGSTGEIELITSTPGGPYVLYYTTWGAACPTTDSVELTIGSNVDPSFSYAQSSYCEGAGTVLPNALTTTGGVFSGPSEIVFVNTTTGEIDLNASTPGGPYAIQYWVANTYCEDSTTFSLSILPFDDASFTYASTIFCNNEVNPVANTITSPGGIFSSGASVVIPDATTGEIDVASSTPGGPYYIVYTTSGACPASDSIAITIEDAPDPTFAYAQTVFCSSEGTATPSSVTTAGGTFSGPTGMVIDAVSGEIDLMTSIPGTYAVQYHVSSAFCEDSTTFSVTIYTTDDASFSYGGNHFCTNEPNVTPTSITIPGGSFAASTGLVVNSISGEIDVVASSPGGPYFVYYTTNGAFCPATDSVEVYIELPPDPSFGYAQSNYCITEGLIQPDFVTTPGGTFSAPSEIVFGNSSIGEIDLTSSTAGGPYSIQYLVSNTYCQKSTTMDITIIDQDDLTSVDYTASAFCISDNNQFPTISGLSGGIFSSDAALGLMDVNTGEISPSSSIAGGPYSMKYVTPGTCPDSVEWQISINEELSAYAGEDQELFFMTKSSLEADDPVSGMGEWLSDSSAIIVDMLDPKSGVTNLIVGENKFVWMVSDGVCPAASDDIIITVEDLFIPQAVTPNDDGKNDYFELHSLDEVTCDLKVFNRWGQIIYENSDYQNEWYGQNQNGDQLENDTYFYVILIDDYLEYNGYVVLKK